MEKINRFVTWYKQTATLLGIPILMLLLCVGVQKVFFTSTCQVLGWKCEYSIGATDAMTEYMGQLLASNQGMDIVAQPRRKN